MTHTPICHLPLGGRMGGGSNMKQYISPEMVIVHLSTKNVVLQMSMELFEEEVNSEADILTKGVVNNHKNIWEEEW